MTWIDDGERNIKVILEGKEEPPEALPSHNGIGGQK
jgi:hypothetical protein